MVKCEVCDEEFMQNIQLKIHKRLLHADLRSMVGDKAGIVNAVGDPPKNPPPTQQGPEAGEVHSQNKQNGVVGRAPVTSRESSSAVPRQGRASFDNEAIVPKIEPSSPSSVSSTSAKENNVIANKTNHESALRAVENQSVAKKKTAESRCPHPKCKAIVAEADIPDHLKSVHDLHLCECGELKTSLQKLENHQKTCGMNQTTPQSPAPAPVQSTGKRQNSQNSNPGEPSEKRLKSNRNPHTLSSANASNKAHNETTKSSSNQTDSGRAASRTRKSTARIISSDEEDGDETDSVQGSRQVSPGSARSPRRGSCAYKCTKCSQEFSRQSALDSHTKACHTKNSDEFLCDECGEEFSSEKKLDLHYKRGGCNKRIIDSDYEPEDSSRSPSKEPGSGSGKSGNESSGGKSTSNETVLNSKVTNTSKNTPSTQSTATPVTATTATPDAAPASTPTVTTPVDTHPVQPTVVASPTIVIPPVITSTRLCNFCNTPFPDKLDLAYHLLKHNEEYGKDKSGSFSFLADGINKQVKCVVCGGAFQKRSDMIAHLQAYHHKTGTYPCAECHQKFTESSVLLSHCDEKHPAMSGLTSANMRTATHHSNSNKSNEYICPVMDCRKKHSTLPDLNEHHKTAHPERPWFVCPLTDCNAPYATEKSLNRHLQKEHNMGPFRRFVR